MAMGWTLQPKWVLGRSCPTFPVWQGPFPAQLSSSSVFSSNPTDTFCMSCIAAQLLLWRRMWTALPTTLVGPGAPFQPSLRPSVPAPVTWHQCRRRAGLQLCPSPALLSQAWPTGWHPGLASAHPCPHGAQGWGRPRAVPLPGWAGEALPCQLLGEPPLQSRELLDLTGTQMSR